MAAHVDWGIVWRYLVGATAMFLLLRTVAILPSKAMLYIGLGIIPFAADLLPKRLTPDITRPGAPYICGAFIIVLQLMAGAAGHILDIFFQKSQLDRKTIVGTKAVTQVAGHLYRIAYFGSFEFAFDVSIPWWGYAGAIALSFAGTSLAAPVLVRMTDEGFRMWSRRVTIGVGVLPDARAVAGGGPVMAVPGLTGGRGVALCGRPFDREARVGAAQRRPPEPNDTKRCRCPHGCGSCRRRSWCRPTGGWRSASARSRPCARPGVEVDGIAAGMPRNAAGAGDARAGAAGRDDLHAAELRLDAAEQGAGRRRQAAPRGAGAGKVGESALSHGRAARRRARVPAARAPAGMALARALAA